MLARLCLARLLSCLLLFAVLLVDGCAGTVNSGTRDDSAPGHPTLITSERIAASGAKTAWDALRRFVPFVHFRESHGAPIQMTRRGTASIYLDDQVRVILDNVRVYDIRLLNQIPAADILTLQVLSGLEATTYYGATSTSGVVVIRTKTALQ